MSLFTPDQVEDAARIASSLSILLNNPVGHGKTRVALAAARAWLRAGVVDHAVIFVRKSTINMTWAAETDAVFPDLQYAVVTGDLAPKKRVAVWEAPLEMILCNWELMTNRADLPRLDHLMREKRVAILGDEAHALTSHMTRTHKIFLHLRAMAHRVVLITGTPLLTTPADLYGLMTAAGYDFGTYRQYLAGWCTVRKFRVPNPKAFAGFTEVVEPTGFQQAMLPRLRERLVKAVIRRPVDETSLPVLRPPVYWEVELNAEERAAYEAIKLPPMPTADAPDPPAPVGPVEPAGYEAVMRKYVGTHLGEHGELRAVLSGKRSRTLPPAKDQMLMDVLPGLWAGGEKVVVFSPFRETVERIERFIPACTPGHEVATITGSKTLKQREAAFAQFRDDPACDTLCITTAACEGLNLQGCASRVLFFDRVYVPAVEHQVLGRVYRKGQKKPVVCGYFVVKNTIDADIARAHRKRLNWMEVVDELSRADLTPRGAEMLAGGGC